MLSDCIQPIWINRQLNLKTPLGKCPVGVDQNINTIFNYLADIRKAIYTTNAVEFLNSVIRKAIKKRKIFPSDDSAKKMVYLAITEASKKWSMPIHNWRQAMVRFIIEFGHRLEKHLK
jgi:putative transposase